MVQQFMLRQAGNVLRDDQAYLLEARLPRICKQHGFANLQDFVSAACERNAPRALANALIDALTTHETMFFRDASFWRTLQASVLPALIERAASGRHIKIWSAACSSGQEPYSLAIMLRELATAHSNRFSIVATDVAEATVAQARDGFFTSLEVNRGLDIKRLSANFTQAPGGFRVKDELKQMITWQTHNLLGLNADPTSCDIVLCRNVLIYFNETDRNSALKRLLKSTLTGGYLGIGATESCREPGLQSVAAGLYQKSI